MLPLAAYANRLSVRPGEAIEFKVSSQSNEPYAARLVRVICADANPAGPGLREEAISAPLEGPRPSRKQVVQMGSHARIENTFDLAAGGHLTFVATIWPTTPGSGRRQGILSAYDPNVRVGLALAIGEDGSVEALLGATRVKTRVACMPRTWSLVWATFDTRSRVLKVGQAPLARGQVSGPAAEAQIEADGTLPPKGMPWIVGALGGAPVRGHFNGKIERPMIFDRALSADAIAQAAGGAATQGLIASWDFSKEMSSVRIDRKSVV